MKSQYPLKNRGTLFLNAGTLMFKTKKRTSKSPGILMTYVQRAFRQSPQAEDVLPLVAPAYMEDI